MRLVAYTERGTFYGPQVKGDDGDIEELHAMLVTACHSGNYLTFAGENGQVYLSTGALKTAVFVIEE